MNYRSIAAISFNVGNDIYIYDRYSNEFLNIDEITEKILDDTYNVNFEPANYAYDAKEVLKRYEEIERAKADDDVLKPFIIPKMSISKDKTTLEKVQGKIDEKICNLVFCTTENCNLRCKYCVYSGMYANSTRGHCNKPLKWDIAQKAIEQYIKKLKQQNNNIISFYGGEPLLNFEIIKQTVDYVKGKDLNIRFALNTNLTLANDEIIKFLIDNKFILSVSIDGPECIHDMYRVSSNEAKSHNVVLQNLKKIKYIDNEYFNHDVIFGVVIVPHNYDLDILDNYFNSDIFKDVDIDNIKTLPINNDENSFFSQYDYWEFIKKFDDYTLSKFIAAHKNGKTDFSDMKVSYQYHIRGFRQIYFREMNRMNEYNYFWPNGICIPGMRSLFVSTDGYYYPCEKMNDLNPLIIGNVFDGYDVEKTTKLIDEYATKSLPLCASCWAYRFCGSCFMLSQVDGRYSETFKEQSCNGIKRYYYQLFQSYIEIVKETPDAFYYLDEKGKDEIYNDMRSE